MKEIIKFVDPVKARSERKARRREEQAMTTKVTNYRVEMKQDLKLSKKLTQARIRATTPLVDVLDLVDTRRESIRGIEKSTDNIIIALRRRLILAEKLVKGRTLERDLANRAHKSKCEALKQSQNDLHRAITKQKELVKFLFKRVETLEAKLEDYQEREIASVISTNGIELD
jgi:hypothetical protein